MNCLKKITASIIAAAISVTTLGITLANDSAQNALNLTKAKLLESVGIIENVQSTGNVTRGDFVKIMQRFVDADDFAIQGSGEYSDITDEAVISAAGYFRSLGILSPSANFYPDNIIADAEAIKIVVSVLGLGIRAENEGGFPQGYVSAASKNGLLKKINCDNELSFEEMTELLYNALFTNVYEVTIKGKNFAKSDTNCTALEYYHDIYALTGVVQANERTGLLSVNERMPEGYIKFNGDEFSVKDTVAIDKNSIKDCLGYRIKAYVSDKNNENKIVAFEEMSNKICEINAEEVTDFKNFTLVTEKKKYEVEKDYSVIYNGVAADDFSNEQLVFEDGRIDLLDSDSNGKYDTVFVWKKEYIIKGVFTNNGDTLTDINNHIYGKDKSAVICLNDDDVIYEYLEMTDGTVKEASMRELSNCKTFTLWQSLDGSFVRILGYTNEIKGTLDAVSEDSVVINGQEIKLSYYAKENKYKSSANELIYLLTDDGKLIDCEEQKNTMQYGYFMQVKEKKKGFGGYEAYLLTENGEKNVYEFAETVLLDGARENSKEAIKDNKIHSYMIARYCVNDENLIKKIDTADSDHLYERNLDPENSMQKYFDSEMYWYNNYKMISPYLKIASAVIFTVPTALANETSKSVYKFNIDDFFVGDMPRVDEKKFHFECYDYKETGDCGALIRYSDSNPEVALKELSHDSPVAVVDSIKTAKNEDGDYVTKVTLLNGRKYFSYFFSELLEKTFKEEDRKINVGDIVRYDTTAGTLSNLEVEFFFNEWKMNDAIGTDKVNEYRNHPSYGVRNIVHYHVGTLYNVTNAAVLIRDDMDGDVYPANYSESVFFKYDKDLGYFKPVDKSELITEVLSSRDTADKVVAVTRYFYNTNLVVIY